MVCFRMTISLILGDMYNILHTNGLLQNDDVLDLAIDKINSLLESFLGINDAELGKTTGLCNVKHKNAV